MGDNRQRMGKRATDKWRAKIQIGAIVHRLNNQALGNIEMTPNSLKAALKLVDKFLPNLQQVSSDHTHDHQHSIRHIEIAPVSTIQRDALPATLEGDCVLVDDDASPMNTRASEVVDAYVELEIKEG